MLLAINHSPVPINSIDRLIGSATRNELEEGVGHKSHEFLHRYQTPVLVNPWLFRTSEMPTAQDGLHSH